MDQWIRRAVESDLCRMAEILVFSKRSNYRCIFHNDAFSFGELQVVNVMEEYRKNPEKLERTWVYDDEFVKGLIQIKKQEIETFYVEPLLTNEGIGGKLMDFAINKFNVNTLWVLEKNKRARVFYERKGFYVTEKKRLEEGTTEYLLEMKR